MPDNNEIDQKITFADHKAKTAKDIEAIIVELQKLTTEVLEGNMQAFEEFWCAGGTEEADAKIIAIRELLLLRYFHRQELIA